MPGFEEKMNEVDEIVKLKDESARLQTEISTLKDKHQTLFIDLVQERNSQIMKGIQDFFYDKGFVIKESEEALIFSHKDYLFFKLTNPSDSKITLNRIENNRLYFDCDIAVSIPAPHISPLISSGELDRLQKYIKRQQKEIDDLKKDIAELSPEKIKYEIIHERERSEFKDISHLINMASSRNNREIVNVVPIK